MLARRWPNRFHQQLLQNFLQKYRQKSPLQIVKDVGDFDEVEEFDVENTVFNVDVLLGFIQNLPDKYRLVFNLYALDNYSHKEIANVLEISEGTSKSNLSRARKILKKQLEIHQQKEQKA